MQSNAACHLCATREPMLPTPTMPTVLPHISVPRILVRSSFSSERTRRSSSAMRRPTAMARPIASSATASLFTPGVRTTGMPCFFAAATSMLS